MALRKPFCDFVLRDADCKEYFFCRAIHCSESLLGLPRVWGEPSLFLLFLCWYFTEEAGRAFHSIFEVMVKEWASHSGVAFFHSVLYRVFLCQESEGLWDRLMLQAAHHAWGTERFLVFSLPREASLRCQFCLHHLASSGVTHIVSVEIPYFKPSLLLPSP